MKNFAIATILFALTTCLALGADVSGQWTGQVPGRDGQTAESTFTFKVDGSALTGSVTSPRGERPIEEGKISGDEISFSQTLEMGGNKMKILYKGKVSDSEIKFTRQREGGQGAAQEFVAKRKAS